MTKGKNKSTQLVTVQQVKQLIAQQSIRAAELKHKNLAYSVASCGPGGTIYQAFNPGEGLGENDREGAKIRAQKFEASFQFKYFSYSSLPLAQVRITVFVDRLHDGTDASATDLYGAAYPTNVSLLSSFNVPSKYNVLYDKRFPLSAPTAGVTSEAPPYLNVDISLNLNNMLMEWNGANYFNYHKNNLFVMVVGTFGDVSGPDTLGEMRMWYTDV